MLEITIPAGEAWDEKKEEFRYSKEYKLKLEHSLISISKWESRWKKAFLSNKHITDDEMFHYITCMCVTPNVPIEVFLNLSAENMLAIREYINDSMSATFIYNPTSNNGSNGPAPEAVTSELVYYWMISYRIPVEFEKWHINRLLTLIDVFRAKNNPKKRSIREVMQGNAALNAQRRAMMGSKG